MKLSSSVSKLDLRELRILFVAASLGQGGAERQLFHMVSELNAAASTTVVASLKRGEFWEDPLRKRGVTINFFGERGFRLMRVVRLLGIARKHQVHIIQSQHFHMNFYAAAVGILAGIPVIGALRSDTLTEMQSAGRIGGTLSLRAPPHLAANSRRAISNAISCGIKEARLHFLPNVVDTNFIKPIDQQRNRQPVRLLMAGRLVPDKRAELFLEALAVLKDRTVHGTFKATIVGDGPHKSYLQKRSIDLGLGPDLIEFRNGLSDMRTAYAEADVVVLTSKREGTPNVLLEGMAAGLCLIATAVGGVPDIVLHERNGLLVEPEDREGLVQALARVTSDRSCRERFGKEGRTLVVQTYSLSNLVPNLHEIYRKVLNP